MVTQGFDILNLKVMKLLPCEKITLNTSRRVLFSPSEYKFKFGLNGYSQLEKEEIFR